ncbi:MAG: hypothetical protein ACK4IT_08890 [Thioalkalivibrionaceae bacterium]
MTGFSESALSYPKNITYNFHLEEKRHPIRLTHDGQPYFGVLLPRKPGDTQYRVRLTERLSPDLKTTYYMSPIEIPLPSLDGVVFMHQGHHAH